MHQSHGSYGMGSATLGPLLFVGSHRPDALPLSTWPLSRLCYYDREKPSSDGLNGWSLLERVSFRMKTSDITM